MNEMKTRTYNLPEEYTRDNYLEAGQRLAKAGQVLQWEFGRWFDALDWGDKQDTCEEVGINYSNAKNCAVVYRKFKSLQVNCHPLWVVIILDWLMITLT